MDIQKLIKDILATFTQSVTVAVAGYAPEIVNSAKAYVTEGEERLAKLATGALSGELAYDFIVRRLKEEVTTLKDALIGVEQQAANDVQTLANNLIGVFREKVDTEILNIQG
jgi:hypothetical protein